MSDHNQQQVSQKIDGNWPKLPAEKDLLNTKEMRIVKIYYYLDPNTGQMDADRTLNAMLWRFNQLSDGWCPNTHSEDPAENLSTYLSIMNVFTYPEFEEIAPKLPIGIKFQPTPFTATTWQEEIPNFNIPLSGDDTLAALAMYILLLQFKDPHSLIYKATDICVAAGALPSRLFDAFELDDYNWRQIATFMTHPYNIAFSKHIYDCLIRKAVAIGNKKAQDLLRLCGEELPDIIKCKTSLID